MADEDAFELAQSFRRLSIAPSYIGNGSGRRVARTGSSYRRKSRRISRTEKRRFTFAAIPSEDPEPGTSCWCDPYRTIIFAIEQI